MKTSANVETGFKLRRLCSSVQNMDDIVGGNRYSQYGALMEVSRKYSSAQVSRRTLDTLEDSLAAAGTESYRM